MTEHREHSTRSPHVGFESLNDYVDGRLDLRAKSLIDYHLATCQECARELASLRALLGASAALPRVVLPDDDLWAGVKASIDDRKGIVLPSAGSHTTGPESGSVPATSPWKTRVWLAAAAVVLIALSSATTAVVLRSTGQTTVAENSTDTVGSQADLGAPPGLPVSFRHAEGQYAQTIDQLLLLVEAQRGQLSPNTIRTVDRSLAVVDSAIAEARAALLADPSNRTLVDLLSASYQRKLDLLRRTSELSSRI